MLRRSPRSQNLLLPPCVQIRGDALIKSLNAIKGYVRPGKHVVNLQKVAPHDVGGSDHR